MMREKKIDLEESGGIGYNQMPPKDIFAYNELRSCFDVFNLYNDKILDIQPEFQRNEVWPPIYQTRFIDSLLKELPIPSMCFSYDKERNKMQVIDGLQRMVTIIKFLDTEKEWKLLELDDIDPKISGKTNIEIKNENLIVFNNIKNLSLPVTFLRVNSEKAEHNEYLFEIFHRLNTYGTKLNNQEIRNCIFSGPFNNLIKELNKEKNWKALLKIGDDKRFLKAELILRFFAFYDDNKKYDGNLTKFLNEYMSSHRNEKESDLQVKRDLFKGVVELIFNKISDNQELPKRTSNAFIDALLFGIAKNLTTIKKLDDKAIKGLYEKLCKENAFSKKSLLEGTMKVVKVSQRLKKSQRVFSNK